MQDDPEFMKDYEKQAEKFAIEPNANVARNVSYVTGTSSSESQY